MDNALNTQIQLTFSLSNGYLRDLVLQQLGTSIDHFSLHRQIEDWQLTIQLLESPQVKLAPWSIENHLSLSFSARREALLGAIQITGQLSMTLTTTYQIQADWTLQTSTDLKHYEWTKKPRLALGRLDFSVRRLADWLIEKGQAELMQQIGQMITAKVRLKERLTDLLARVWQAQPIQHVYLLPVGQIEQIVLQQSSAKDGLRLELLIAGQLAARLQTTAAPSPAKPSLPSFTRVLPPAVKTSTIAIEIPYQDIWPIVAPYLQGRTFPIGPFQIGIDGMAIEKVYQDIKYRIRYRGWGGGQVDLQGLPIFDEQAQAIHVQQLQLLWRPHPWWVRWCTFFLTPFVKQFLIKRLPMVLKEFETASFLKQVPSLLEPLIKNRLDLSSFPKTFRCTGLQWQAEQLQIQITSKEKGRFRFQINEINF